MLTRIVFALTRRVYSSHALITLRRKVVTPMQEIMRTVGRHPILVFRPDRAACGGLLYTAGASLELGAKVIITRVKPCPITSSDARG